MTEHKEQWAKISVQRASPDFQDWDKVLELLRTAFAYQEYRIDPPSSVSRLDAGLLAEKTSQERLFLASVASELVGCVFVEEKPTLLYIGKLAVWPQLQGRGIGRCLMNAVESFARETGRAILELETRVELIENHRTFGSFGFRKVSEHAHEGYDRPTYIRMQKVVGSDVSASNDFADAQGTKVTRHIVFTPNAAKPPPTYSQAVKAAGLVFISGTAPTDPATNAIVGTTIQEQTSQCLKNIQAILEAAGSSLDKLVSATIVLADEDDFAGMNEEWLKWFPANPPARQGAKMPVRVPGLKVSIAAIAEA